ncbi:MAG: type II toxin-antitoxin system VapC family toxin [Chloroflexi bacterium]|nr:type II toxin-antitoxin system VapC family toxin [Chloroflexota bacterium]
MTIYYLDSSAIVKRYVDEWGSAWVRQICAEREAVSGEKLNSILIGEIAVAEVAAAFAVLVRRNAIVPPVGEHVYEKFIREFRDEYTLVHLTASLILSAAELTQRHPLKGYDAVQLALALHASKSLQADDLSLTFVTGDETLLHAARAEGLTTENPFEHTD